MDGRVRHEMDPSIRQGEAQGANKKQYSWGSTDTASGTVESGKRNGRATTLHYRQPDRGIANLLYSSIQRRQGQTKSTYLVHLQYGVLRTWCCPLGLRALSMELKPGL